MKTLSDCALAVLTTHDPIDKAKRTHEYVEAWKSGEISIIGKVDLPDRPSRPDKPELRPSREMPKRGKAGTRKSKVALLHALAHIELNAIDLAWDVLARFAHYAIDHKNKGQENGTSFTLPNDFYDQWASVAYDEAKHFLMLEARLNDLGATYGGLPAHDGLWESAMATQHDIAARLAIVPMVLEARGLDVTPNMIAAMKRQDDLITADLLQTIHDDEIGHVEAGTIWFNKWCEHHGLNAKIHWQDLVTEYFKGYLKRPFNDPSRAKAGLFPDWYEPLAGFETNKGAA